MRLVSRAGAQTYSGMVDLVANAVCFRPGLAAGRRQGKSHHRKKKREKSASDIACEVMRYSEVHKFGVRGGVSCNTCVFYIQGKN